jgi:subtilase family serine protease
MSGRFRHVAAVVTVTALMAGPNAVSAAASVPAAVDGPTTARIGLAGADPDGLLRFASAVSDPHSKLYRHFLTPAQVRARFGPTAAQVGKVHAWLAENGLRTVGENAHWIDVTGTPGKVSGAFGNLVKPKVRVGPGGDYAVRAAAAVPAGLVGVVSSVSGLAPATRGMREFSYRVAAGPRDRVLGGDAVDPGGPMQPAGPATPPAAVNPGGPMQPTGPSVPALPIMVGGPITRSLPDTRTLPADPGDPTLPTTSTTACSTDWGRSPAVGLPKGYNKPDPLAVCGYSPKQLRAAYGVTASGFTGKGAVIGVVGAYGSPTMRADADRFATSVGDKAFADGQYLESVDHGAWRHLGDGVCETPAAWGGEEALDVEMAHGLAPAAAVHYFGAASCQDQDIAATLAAIVDHRSADVVTGSFGELMHAAAGGGPGDIDPALVEQENTVFITGAAEGIGFAFATGDCGDQAPKLNGPACDPDSARPQVAWPAASPWVTAVGGTALAAAPNGTRRWEIPMGDLRSDLSTDGSAWSPLPGAFFFGGGGGASEDFGQPKYQKAVVPKELAHTAGGRTIGTAQRTVPDIALDGDLTTAVRTGHTDPTLGGYGQDVVGGTSVAAPLFAAVQADAVQAAGGALGFANPALYKRAGTKQFTDIVDRPKAAPNPISAVVDHGMFGTVHEARLFKLGADHGLTARKGYDTATGLGAPTAEYIKSFKPAGKKAAKS